MDWIEANRELVGWSWALVAAALTVLWTKVVPRVAKIAAKPRSTVIRYAHPVCWAFLSLAGVAYALDTGASLVRGLCFAALIAYVAFIAAIVRRTA